MLLLYDAKSLENLCIPALSREMAATPPSLEFLLQTPYGEDWKDQFKAYVASQTNKNELLEFLTSYANHLSQIQDATQKKKKGIQLANRLHELKKAAYTERTGRTIPVDKVGVVLVRSDGKALYTTNENGQLGFPKGQYEYTLTNANDIFTAHPEGLAKGALRELREETGFTHVGKIRPFENIYSGILERTLGGEKDKLSILFGAHEFVEDRFYLVLYVDSKRDLKSNAVPKNDENLVKVSWEEQYSRSSPNDYNSFSKITFEFYPDQDRAVNYNNNNYTSSRYRPKKKGKTRSHKLKRPDESQKTRSRKKKSKSRGTPRSR